MIIFDDAPPSLPWVFPWFLKCRSHRQDLASCCEKVDSLYPLACIDPPLSQYKASALPVAIHCSALLQHGCLTQDMQQYRLTYNQSDPEDKTDPSEHMHPQPSTHPVSR